MTIETRPEAAFPGITSTADGGAAVAYVDTQITQGACAYPITPSTGMGQAYEVAVANGQRNLWDQPLAFLETGVGAQLRLGLRGVRRRRRARQ